MSYDISLSIDTGAEELTEVVAIANLTYNVAPIIEKALGAGLYSLNNNLASEAEPKIQKALEYMRKSQKALSALNPPNGWGSLDGTILVFDHMLREVKKHPKTILEIS